MFNPSAGFQVLALATLLNFCSSEFNLVILHTNDIHARFEEFSGSSGTTCGPGSQCFGGVARRYTRIRQVREQEENVLLLDAGDQFQGTVWYSYYKWKLIAYFMNYLGYDSMCFGNHEFDDGIPGLIPFLKNITFPVLASNVDASKEPDIQPFYSKSTVLEVGGQRIAVIGYVTAETATLSSPGNLQFLDEVESIRKEVERLASDGIDKIVALGHAGIDVDLRIARQVAGVDVVVGGHTNTFLYRGDPPSTEIPYDDYPIVIHPESDPAATVLVVQDYAYGKYLGHLDVTFSDDGKVTSWSGNPFLLDNSTAKDEFVLNEIKELSKDLDGFFEEIVGETYANLLVEEASGRRVCRTRECNMGNLIADAYLEAYLSPSESSWSNVSIVIFNGGSLRANIDQGEITAADVLTVLPFGSSIDMIGLQGVHIREMLEHSVSRYTPDSDNGEFLQMSGMRVSYDVSKPNGSRVYDVEVLCSDCLVPDYEKLESQRTYKIITNSFLANGGDGYSVVKENKLFHYDGELEYDLVIKYLRQRSPVINGNDEGRIKFVEDPCASDATHHIAFEWLSVSFSILSTLFCTCM